VLDFRQLARRVMACDDVVEPIVAAQVAKKLASDRRDAIQEQKKLKRVKVQKHVAASGDAATLFLAEGDSAMGFLLKVRDPVTVGGFPLRGVIMNVYEKKPIEILKNKELADLIAVLGLDINDPDSVDRMYYQRIATLTDADHDGIGHIMPLLLVFFYRFWPRLFSEGRVAITRTPILISTNGKDTRWFYSYESASQFKQSDASRGYTHRYIKGLASHTEEEYRTIINQPKLDTVVIDDPRWFDVVFGDDSGPRKEWIVNKGVVASLSS
jgi:DNA gyrase/topoisomerase IV subunit B